MTSHQYEHMTSDSDDESFVVLSSSIPPESLLEIKKEDVEQFDQEVIKQSLSSTNETLIEMSSKSEQSDKLPSLPKVDGLANITMNGNILTDTTSSIKSNVSDLSQSEIQQRVDNLIEENAKLKDALVQNHLTLKKQYDTIAMWNEDVQKVHEIHKQKFAETKAYVEKLKIENTKLKESLQVAETTISCLREEVDSLKSRDSNIKQLNVELYKNTIDNLSKLELDAAQNRIRELEELLSKVKVSSDEDETDFSIQEELEKLKKEKDELNRQLSEEQKQSVMRQSKLIEEIDTLKSTFTLKSTMDKEALEKIREQLMLSQIQITELQEERRKDKEVLRQKEIELNDYKEGLNSLQARVVDPAIIAEKNARIEELEGILRDNRGELEMVPLLKQQLELYRTDFEAERESKNSLKSQKDSLADDLSNLQRRNQQLLEEVERLRPTGTQSRTPTVLSGAPQEIYASHLKYRCPLCMQRFTSYAFYKHHIDMCKMNGF